MQGAWALAGLLLIAAFLPAKPHVRLTATLGVVLVVLAVFQTTGGRGSVSFTASYVVVFAVAAIALLRFRSESTPWVFVPLLVYLALGVFAVWDGGSGQSGGLINIIFAVGAWTAGLFLGVLYRDNPKVERRLVVLLLLLVTFELVVCLLQSVGVDIFSVEGRTGELEGGRSNGTYTHPSTIGKVLTLTAVLLLPSTRSRDGVTRRLAMSGFVISILPILISLSRANLLAIGAMVLVWSFVQPREKFFGRRFTLPAMFGVFTLVFLDTIFARFQESTGERDHFMTVALEQLARDPWFGVGPAGYIRTVGQYDPLTADGWPVHNIFVLQAVELGIVGAALFYLPFCVVLIRAFRFIRVPGRRGDFARAIIAYLPALIVIGWTGWGLLAPGALALMCFVFAFAYVQMKAPDRASNDLRALRVRAAIRSGEGPR